MASAYPADTSNGAVVRYIPLTTTFTPTQGCSRLFRLNGPSLVAYDPGYGLDIDKRVVCQPSAVTSWWEQARLGVGDTDHTAVSLGPLICPDQWATVASSVKDESSTLHMCCPKDYYLANGTPGSAVGDCLSDVSSGMTLTFASTSAAEPSDWTTATTTLRSDSTVGAIAVVGWNIKLATSAPETTGSSTASESSSTSSAQDSSADASSGPSGLSTGASVGIGVGVALGVIGIAALLVAMYLIRRKKNKKIEAAAAAAVWDHSTTPGPKPPTPPQRHELDPEGVPQELVSHNVHRPLVELSA